METQIGIRSLVEFVVGENGNASYVDVHQGYLTFLGNACVGLSEGTVGELTLVVEREEISILF